MNRDIFRHICGEWTRARVTALVLALSAAALSDVHSLVSQQTRAYVGLAQSSAMVAMVLAVVWYVSRTDEFVRRYWSLAAAFGFVAGVVGLLIIDGLRAAGTYHGAVEDPGRLFVLPFGAAMIYFTLRYRWLSR